MTDRCEELRDQMPDVANGGRQWNAEEAAHVAGCADCAREWQLVQVAMRLGDGAAGRVNTTRLSAAVLAGVARERRVAGWKRAGWLTGLAAAAAVVLIVWRGPAPPTVHPDEGAVSEYLLPLAELESLDENQLQAVLEALDAPLQDGSSSGGPNLGDLDDTQLERVLRSLEG